MSAYLFYIITIIECSFRLRLWGKFIKTPKQVAFQFCHLNIQIVEFSILLLKYKCISL